MPNFVLILKTKYSRNWQTIWKGPLSEFLRDNPNLCRRTRRAISTLRPGEQYEFMTGTGCRFRVKRSQSKKRAR